MSILSNTKNYRDVINNIDALKLKDIGWISEKGHNILETIIMRFIFLHDDSTDERSRRTPVLTIILLI